MAKLIRTEDGFEFSVDQGKLISRSKYFKSLFQYNDQLSILIRGVRGDVLKQLLKYEETLQLEVKEHNLLVLFEAADYLMLDDAFKQVSSLLPNVLTTGNCIDILNAALRTNHVDITNLCYCYVRNHFDSVVENANIGNVSIDHLKQLLTDKDLVVDSEDNAWEAVVKWIGYNSSERIIYLLSLILCIRLDVCTEKCIGKMMSHAFLHESQALTGIVNLNNPTDFIAAVKSLSTKTVNFGARQSAFLVEKEKFVIFHELYVISGEGKNIARVPYAGHHFDRFHYFRDNRIYAVDGYGKYAIGCFDLLKGEWAYAPYPTKATYEEMELSFVALGNRIFFLWVEHHSTALNVVMYDPELNEWQGRQSFTSRGHSYQRHVQSLAAAVYNDLIYVGIITGEDDSLFMLGGVYHPDADKWEEWVALEAKSVYVHLYSFDGGLWMMQGNSKVVQRFYPEQNAWRHYMDLPSVYENPRPEIKHEKLYLSGIDYGGEGERTRWKDFQWDPETQGWRERSITYHDHVVYVMQDADVVRKYHRQLMDQEWENLLKEWK